MTTEPATWRPWVIATLLFFLMFINFADRAIIGLAAVPIMQDMHLSPVQWGAVGSSFYYLFAISTLVFGFVADRVATKWVLALLASIWALTQFLMVGTASLSLLIASRIVLGAGEGPAFPVAIHAVYKWFPSARRTLPTGVVAIGSSIGVTAATPLLLYVIYAYSWHAAFGLLGGLGLVWVACWLLLGTEGHATSTAVANGRASGERVPYLRLFTCPTVLGVLVGGWVASWGLALLVVWVPAFVQNGLGYGIEATKWLVTLTWLATAVIAPLVGWLSQHWQGRGASSRWARGIPAAAFVTASGTALAVALLLDHGAVQIGVFIVAFATGGVIYTLGPAILDEVTPTRQRGAVLGITTAIHSTAGLVAPTVTGHLIAAAATPSEGYFSAFMLAACLIAAGGLVATLLIRPEADSARLVARSPSPASA